MEILRSQGVIDIGRRPGVSFVEKFGRNTAVDTSGEDIWDGGGIYDFPDVASIMNVKSTSAEDGAGTLTGAIDIRIQGLDENYDFITEDVIMNGIVDVPTTKTFIRVFRAGVLNAGSNLINVGDITITSVAEAIIVAQITSDKGQTNMALYTIPRGHIGFLKKWYASILRAGAINAVAVDVDMFRRNIDSANSWKSTQPIGIMNNGGAWQYEFIAPIELPEKSDIIVNAIPSATADISSGFTILLMHS